MLKESVFGEFIGSEVKAPYRDGSQFKIARGMLKEVNKGFVKIGVFAVWNSSQSAVAEIKFR